MTALVSHTYTHANGLCWQPNSISIAHRIIATYSSASPSVSRDSKEMKMMYLLLGVVLCLVGLQSEAMPYVSFMGRTLANNSYVDMNFVGNDSDQYNNLLCHTDLSSCCSNPQGPHRGDWYFPNGSRFQFSHVGFYESRGEQVVILQKELGTDMPSGIYRCGIPTVAVHDDTNIFVRQSVYVGIYAHGGKSLCIY